MSFCILIILFMNDAIEGLRNRLGKWKEVFEGKDLKVNLVKIKVMVSQGITNV